MMNRDSGGILLGVAKYVCPVSNKCYELRSGLEDRREEVSFDSVCEEEEVYIVSRRLKNNLASSETSGLALSGGGVRAAAIARGFIQYLVAKENWLDFDYVSSVSGGGYTSNALTGRVGTLKCADESEPFYGRGSISPSYKMWQAMAASIRGAQFIMVPMISVGALFLFNLLAFFDFNCQQSSAGIFSCVMLAISLIAMVGHLGRWDIAERNKDKFVAAYIYGSFFSFSVYCYYCGVALWYWPLVVIAIYLWSFGVFLRNFSHLHKSDGVRTAKQIALVMAVAYCVALLFSVLSLEGRSKLFIGCVDAAFSVAFVIAVAVSPGGDVPNWNAVGLYSYYRRVLRESFFKNRGDAFGGGELVGVAGGAYPIINAAANDGRKVSHFELAPFFSGSRSIGFYRTAAWFPSMTVLDAIAISACALDRYVGRSVYKLIGGIFGSGLGYWAGSSPGRQKSILIFEHLSILIGARSRSVLRLSDGGHFDNLGVYSLLLRKVRKIVCLDLEDDPNFEFDGLRELCRRAEIDFGARIIFPDLSNYVIALKFGTPKEAFIGGKIIYSSGVEGDIYYVKLHRALSETVSYKSDYDGFPHVTTMDQKLSVPLLTDLQAVGEVFGEEYVRRFCVSSAI